MQVAGNTNGSIKRKIGDALSEVGLFHKMKAMPDELSGGELQRVAIARAMINDPLLILADEPTGNLDPDTSGEILELLRRINSKGTGVLFATHNYEFVRKCDYRIYRLENMKLTQIERNQL
jgi:cell division transport system ATP-binding protein